MKRDVLYVDDEIENLFVFKANFENLFHVYTASSAPQALQLLDRRRFPVVMSNDGMPLMTGRELFQIMGQQHPQVRRVLITGQWCSEELLELVSRGVLDSLIKKPWEFEVVLAILLDAIAEYDRTAVAAAG